MKIYPNKMFLLICFLYPRAEVFYPREKLIRFAIFLLTSLFT